MFTEPNVELLGLPRDEPFSTSPYSPLLPLPPEGITFGGRARAAQVAGKDSG